MAIERSARQGEERSPRTSPGLLPLRDRPLGKVIGGGGEFSSRRNFFSLSNTLYESFLGHNMNIF